MNVTRRQNLALLALIVIFLVAFAVRIYALDAQSMWIDEGVTHDLAMRTMDDSARRVASAVHVPLYFWTMHLWIGVAGDSVFTMRFVSVAFSLLTVALAYALGRKLFGITAGLAAAAFIALNTFSIYYAQEMRMYAMLSAVAGGALWFYIRFIQHLRWRDGVILAILNTMGTLTHYTFAFFMVAQGVMAVLWMAFIGYRALRARSGLDIAAGWRALWPTLWRYTAVNLLWLLLYTPWILGGGPSRIGIHPNISPAVPLEQLLREIQGWLAFGRTYEQNMGGMGIAVYLLLIFGLLIQPKARRDAWTWWKMLLPVAWVLVMLAVYLYLELYLRYMRFLLPAQLAFALWMGRGVWVLWHLQTRHQESWTRYLPKAAAAMAVVGLLFNMSNGLDPLYNDPQHQRDNYKALAERLEQEATAEDAIILDAPNQSQVFLYYYDGEAPVYLLPASGDYDQARQETEQIIEDYRRIYVLFYGQAEQDPLNVVESELIEGAYQVSDEWVGSVRFVRYTTPDELNAPQPVNVRFGEHITLESIAYNSDELRAGDVLQIQLNWQTDAVLEARYKVFLHLVNSEGQLVAQRDSEPGGGSAITPTWQPQQTVVDNHALVLPVDLPAGEYTLLVGLYDLSNPAARLTLEDGADALQLLTIRIQ